MEKRRHFPQFGGAAIFNCCDVENARKEGAGKICRPRCSFCPAKFAGHRVCPERQTCYSGTTFSVDFIRAGAVQDGRYLQR